MRKTSRVQVRKMEKNYDHQSTEDQLYQSWEQSGAMYADRNSDKKPFTIMLPPPNVTGHLHLGHAAMLAIEDILIRFKKMTGHEVLWLPGTDHAAIATENVVIKHLGLKNRNEVSREEFLTECRKFAAEKHDRIVGQMKKMGAWLDWSREAYTFDDARSHAVNTMFRKLYDDGLIAKGHRMINWSTGAQSVLADDELEWEDLKEPFYYLKCGRFIIGTVRSETKCSDSPVIVNPHGKYVKIRTKAGNEELILSQYAWEENPLFAFLKQDYDVVETVTGHDLVGETFEYETYAGKRKFWVVADNVIDMEKGTGAMTVSASHSEDDYELATRLNLQELFVQKIDFHGRMTELAGPCEGMTVEEARKESAKIMKEKGLLVMIDKNYQHRVPFCYRSNSVVEPMVSSQWFISVEKEFTDQWTSKKTTLKKLMQEAVRDGHVKIIPKRFEKTYFQWIDNLRDWCISRQIWWGHRIPVWYGEVRGEEIVAVGSDEELKKKNASNIRQDEDTLDTWFSSALWPFSTLGWPDEFSPDLQKFYPNDVLETGWDIIFFWVARMIMFGRYATGKYPFHHVYLHGMVTDAKGKKMSKSKGNGIDPLDVISEYGADAVRLSLVIGTSPGNPIPLGKDKISGYRNFVNKLWNAGRFVQMQAGKDVKASDTPQSIADKWILSRFSNVAQEVKKHLEKYEISSAGDKIYHFIWDEFCDWYIEASKVDSNPSFLKYIFQEILKLTHPLCPFISEKLWGELAGEELLIGQTFPSIDFRDAQVVENFRLIQTIVTDIRKIRSDQKINPKEKLLLNIQKNKKSDVLQEALPLLKLLAGLNEIQFLETLHSEKNTVKLLIEGISLLLKIPVDEEAEIQRQTKEKQLLQNTIKSLESRLNNKGYLEKAPQHLVEQTQKELEEAKKKLLSLQ